MRVAAGLIVSVALALAGSACKLPREKVWLRVELPPEQAHQASQLEVKPRIAEASRKVGRGVVALELKRDAGRTRIDLRGACPLWVDARQLPREPATFVLKRLFEVGPSERVVGIDREFELRALPSCPEAEAAKTEFVLAPGAPLASFSMGEGGRRLHGKTATALPAKSDSAGVVPVSAREQTRLRSVISFKVQPGPGPAVVRSLGVSAVARSSGLPNVGLNHPVLLSRGDFRLEVAPHESRAALRSVGSLLELTPDLPGVYRLKSSTGQELALQSGRYDQTPLDCGRSDCHAQIAESAASSPMTQVLASDLGGCHALSEPECATACHAVGEPGVADGGFAHVAHELGLPALPPEHDDLPRALRRLGGVGCGACHGPGAIPEPSARWAILRSDVCAVCHDAPPRYGHVLALESSRMGHADHALETRQKACARCHTTWGALGRHEPELAQQALGLGCVTCHDVHPHGEKPSESAAKTQPGLLRDFPLPQALPSPPASYLGPSRVCVSCHAPSSSLLRPEASAAAIVAGQGGLEPATGEALSATGPHAADARGCLSCHDSGPGELVLGKSHGFRATAESCRRCHQTTPGRNPALAKRAQSLLERLDPERSLGTLEKPWHSSYVAVLPTPQQTRALRNVLLVLEDPAADVHHPAYARALLDAAERLSSGAHP